MVVRVRVGVMCGRCDWGGVGCVCGCWLGGRCGVIVGFDVFVV